MPASILVRASVASAVATAMAMLPVFLTAALSVPMRRYLRFDDLGLGLAVSGFFGASAVVSIAGGWLAHRLGAGRSVALGSVVSLAATTAIPLAATGLSGLVSLLLVAGAANAVVQPGASLVLAQVVPVERQGLAFGVNQISAPLAAVMAGIMMPVVALTVGWRWAFAAPLLFGAAVAAVWPRGSTSAAVHPHIDGTRRMRWLLRHPELLLLTAAALLGSTASQALVAFFVQAAVIGGMSPGHAGWLLGAGSTCGLASRMFWGWLADRRDGDRLRDVAALMAVGSVGLLDLAAGSGLLLPAAAGLAFAAGWGWNGLLNYAVVRRYPASPALALGVVTTGIFVGGAMGPFAFGFLARHAGYSFAWSAVALVLLVASCLVLMAVRLGIAHPPLVTRPTANLIGGVSNP